jgi:hypothetical protein
MIKKIVGQTQFEIPLDLLQNCVVFFFHLDLLLKK